MSKKILLVDDEKINLITFSKIYSDKGYEVRTAEDGSSALDLIKEFQPDLVLLDIILGNESGFDILKKIKSDPEHNFIFVVLISGKKISKENQVKGLQMGADGYLTKPLGADELIARTDAFLRHKLAIDSIRKKEQELRNLIEKSPDAILVTNPKGNILYANPAAKELFNLSFDELINMNFGEPNVEGNHSEVNIVKPGGKMVIGEMRSINIEWDNQAASLITIRDITARKQQEDSIKKLNINLEEKFSRKSDELRISLDEMESFSYTISHDLRSPLRAISGFSKILLTEHKDSLNEEGKELLEDIIKNSKRMGSLINDLLEYSRISRKEILKKEIDTKELVKLVYNELIPDNKLKEKIDLRIADLPNAYGDPSLIRVVLKNLLSNAVKYSASKKTPIITISGSREGSSTIFTVADNGIGFNMKYVDKIFGVFEKLHKADDFEGTGVGLALVERILKKHGGKVWAESEVDKGATFHFSLPVNELTEKQTDN